MSATGSTAADGFTHRKRKFAVIRDQLDSDEDGPARTTGPRRKENEDRLHTLVMAGALPWKNANHPTGYSETWGIHSEYFLQLFFSTAEEIVNGDESRAAVVRRKAGYERALAQGIGKPSATDGSKGQWRSALKSRIKSCEWFLGEWSGAEWMHDADLSRAPDGWNPE